MKNITFKKQAEKFLADAATRKRNPLRPASVRTYQAVINQLIPLIGNTVLQDVGNKVVSKVVTELSEQGYSARSIALNVVVIKKIRKSALTPNGDQMFPYEWNSEVVDAPSVPSDKQPIVDATAVRDAISKATMERKALYALLASTGLRISEARAIKLKPDDRVSTVWIPSENKVVVRQQMTRTGLGPTKTDAGVREVDLPRDLNTFLIDNLQDAEERELVFSDCDNSYRDALIEDGITGGFHAFRRFRVTHLRMSGVPDPLVKFWIGHAAGSVTEEYTQVAGKIESRKEWVEKAGLGFKLSELI